MYLVTSLWISDLKVILYMDVVCGLTHNDITRDRITLVHDLTAALHKHSFLIISYHKHCKLIIFVLNIYRADEYRHESHLVSIHPRTF